MDLSAVFFNLLFKNPSEGIEHWNLVKIQHLHEGYLDLYNNVQQYYEKHSELPSFSSFSLITRSEKILSKIASIKKLDIDSDIKMEIIVDALVNEHIQTEALSKIESLVKSITLLDAEEIKNEFNNISIELEEQSANTGSVNNMSDFLISSEEEVCLEQTYLGINNFIDNDVKIMSTELIMLGGERGSGKSVVATNMSTYQYKIGDVGLIFSIEMRKREVFNRSMSMLSGVSNARLRSGTLTEEDYLKLAYVRKDMFLDSDSIFERYTETKDFRKFELELVNHKKLKEDNQLIIVDNQKLTIADIDSIITKQKSIFGSKLKTATIDYVNQIHIDADLYDWKTQIVLSKRLKDLARKHEISIVTPYQIDKSGEARFSKGLLDAADMAFILSVEGDYIDFKTTKIRSGSHFTARSRIEWDSLLIDPTNVSETVDAKPNGIIPMANDSISKAQGVADLQG